MNYTHTNLTMAAVAALIVMISVPQAFGSIIRDFSTGEIFISSENENPRGHKMVLKAILEPNGTASVAHGFNMTQENVKAIDDEDESRIVWLKPSTLLYNFSSARTTDTGTGEVQEIPISQHSYRDGVGVHNLTNAVVDFEDYDDGIYLLDVIANHDFAHEAIVIIGGEPSDDLIDRLISSINHAEFIPSEMFN
jgi:hypothetical protein